MKILFQGDSVTDAGRSRDNVCFPGSGYPTAIAARLGFEEPGKHSFINKGVSGNRVVDLYARMKADMINLKPDVMSILIGVNDVWHELDFQNGVDAPKFEKVYKMLVGELLEALPDLKIMILEPFVLPGSATRAQYEWFRSETEKRAQGARATAEEFSLPFVPLQKLFDEAAPGLPENYWLIDGVHPTPAGHGLIADAWIRTFKEMTR